MNLKMPELPAGLKPNLRWRIVEQEQWPGQWPGQWLTLFHSINDDDQHRRLYAGRWYHAERRWARDGSDSPKYWTGFHVFQSKDAARAYLRRFTAERQLLIIPVWTLVSRPKRSNLDVELVEWMYIPDELND